MRRTLLQAWLLKAEKLRGSDLDIGIVLERVIESIRDLKFIGN